MINNFIISFRFLIQSWEGWRNTYINICFFISFSKSSIVCPDKIYNILTKLFIIITVEVRFAFIEMDFRVDVAMSLKKQFFVVTHFRKFLVDFYCFDIKVVIARYNAIYINYSTAWLSVFSNIDNWFCYSLRW